MTEISRTNQVLALLQQELQRRSETTRTSKSGLIRKDADASAISRLRSIAEREEYGEEEFNRSLIQAVLAERLGDGLVNDRRFQETVDDVLRIIKSDASSRALLMQARGELLGRQSG